MAHAFGLAALVVLGTWFQPVAALAEDRAASATTVEDPDDIFWSAVKDSRTEYPIRIYLENYPHGRHHAEAEARLKALAAPAAAATSPPTMPAMPAPPAPAAAVAPPPSPPPAPAPAVEAVSGTYFAKSPTALRDAPRATAKTLRRIRKGERLTATGRSGDKEWIRIGGAHEGWVDAAALDDEATVEAKEWTAASRTQRQDLLRRYLAEFPAGTHAAEARQKLADLAAAARAAAQAEAKQRAAQETAAERPAPPAAVSEDGQDRAALQSVLKDLRASDSRSSPPVSAPIAAAPAVAAAATLAALGASPIQAPTVRPSPTPGAADAAGSSVMASAAANALAVDGSRGAPPPGGVEGNPSTLPAGDLVAQYDVAVGLLSAGQDGRAEQALETLSREARSGSLAANVRYRLGDLYFKQGNYPRAAAEIQAAYDIDPASPNAPEARRKLAVALAHAGQRGVACAQLREIASTYRGMIAGFADEVAADQREVGCAR